MDPFGQIRVGQQPGRAPERGQQALAAGGGDDPQAPEAGGAAAGADDPVLDGRERGRGVRAGQGAQQTLPKAGVGQAAEVAGNGVRLAEAGRQGAPSGTGGGHPENGVHAGTGVAERPAGAVPDQDEGEQRVPLGVGHGLPTADGGVVAVWVGGVHGRAAREETGHQKVFCSRLQETIPNYPDGTTKPKSGGRGCGHE